MHMYAFTVKTINGVHLLQTLYCIAVAKFTSKHEYQFKVKYHKIPASFSSDLKGSELFAHDSRNTGGRNGRGMRVGSKNFVSDTGKHNF